ncbi:MAG TPA: hypothetical protein VK203_26805 [Nostocaceae cyanobacterium]|nr:hypothetical protein [Nostocaceae cyanobacterium]
MKVREEEERVEGRIFSFLERHPSGSAVRNRRKPPGLRLPHRVPVSPRLFPNPQKKLIQLAELVYNFRLCRIKT